MMASSSQALEAKRTSKSISRQPSIESPRSSAGSPGSGSPHRSRLQDHPRAKDRWPKRHAKEHLHGKDHSSSSPGGSGIESVASGSGSVSISSSASSSKVPTLVTAPAPSSSSSFRKDCEHHPNLLPNMVRQGGGPVVCARSRQRARSTENLLSPSHRVRRSASSCSQPDLLRGSHNNNNQNDSGGACGVGVVSPRGVLSLSSSSSTKLPPYQPEILASQMYDSDDEEYLHSYRPRHEHNMSTTTLVSGGNQQRSKQERFTRSRQSSADRHRSHCHCSCTSKTLVTRREIKRTRIGGGSFRTPINGIQLDEPPSPPDQLELLARPGTSREGMRSCDRNNDAAPSSSGGHQIQTTVETHEPRLPRTSRDSEPPTPPRRNESKGNRKDITSPKKSQGGGKSVPLGNKENALSHRRQDSGSSSATVYQQQDVISSSHMSPYTQRKSAASSSQYRQDVIMSPHIMSPKTHRKGGTTSPPPRQRQGNVVSPPHHRQDTMSPPHHRQDTMSPHSHPDTTMSPPHRQDKISPVNSMSPHTSTTSPHTTVSPHTMSPHTLSTYQRQETLSIESSQETSSSSMSTTHHGWQDTPPSSCEKQETPPPRYETVSLQRSSRGRGGGSDGGPGASSKRGAQPPDTSPRHEAGTYPRGSHHHYQYYQAPEEVEAEALRLHEEVLRREEDVRRREDEVLRRENEEFKHYQYHPEEVRRQYFPPHHDNCSPVPSASTHMPRSVSSQQLPTRRREAAMRGTTDPLGNPMGHPLGTCATTVNTPVADRVELERRRRREHSSESSLVRLDCIHSRQRQLVAQDSTSSSAISDPENIVLEKYSEEPRNRCRTEYSTLPPTQKECRKCAEEREAVAGRRDMGMYTAVSTEIFLKEDTRTGEKQLVKISTVL